MENNYQQTKNSSNDIIPKTSALAKFPLISGRELAKQNKPIDWLLKNVIERQSLNLLFGAPASGKSLIALDWAFCIAEGLEWCGLRTKQSGVVVVAGEGHDGFGRRLKALELKYGMETPQNLVISRKPAQLISKESTEFVAAAIEETGMEPGLIVIDTLHRNMTGDENSSKDIAQFVSNLDNIFKPLGAAILVVHHSGHKEDSRGRGSSAIKGAMDAEFSASQDANRIVTLKCTKSKDFEALNDMSFKINQVELGCLDDDGEEITSVYLDKIEGVVGSSRKKQLNESETSLLDWLEILSRNEGEKPSEDLVSHFPELQHIEKVFDSKSFREKVTQRLSVKGDDQIKRKDAQRKAFDRAKKTLKQQGYIGETDQFIWLVG